MIRRLLQTSLKWKGGGGGEEEEEEDNSKRKKWRVWHAVNSSHLITQFADPVSLPAVASTNRLLGARSQLQTCAPPPAWSRAPLINIVSGYKLIDAILNLHKATINRRDFSLTMYSTFRYCYIWWSQQNAALSSQRWKSKQWFLLLMCYQCGQTDEQLSLCTLLMSQIQPFVVGKLNNVA